MCGIVGYVGDEPAVPILLAGLERLEYRGYDSAGVAVVDTGGDGAGRLSVVPRQRPLADLAACADLVGLAGRTGIGHTRWATHGRPSEANSHPHRDPSGRVAVVHNGIIENHQELRRRLTAGGAVFASETDSEVIAHLVAGALVAGAGDLVTAVRKAIGELEGAFAIAAVSVDEPGVIVGARREAPLVAGVGDGCGVLASDIPAILAQTRDVVVVEDDEIVEVRPGGLRLESVAGAVLEPAWRRVEWDLAAAERGGYPDFMLKEIHEQPEALADTLRARLDDAGRLTLDEVRLSEDDLRRVDKVVVVACGTSYHAGLVAKYALERWARLPVEAEIASEFRYREPVVDGRTLVVGISQSGETADTIAACRHAAEAGAVVVAVSNVVDSTMAREAGAVVYTHAGPEIGVAATKTFTCQIAALQLFALYLAQARGTLDSEAISPIWKELQEVPRLVAGVLADTSVIEDEARRWDGVEDAFFLGRGAAYPVALEGALKMKEISYVHAEGYPAGELKHGPLALIEPGVPVVAVVTPSEVSRKTLSNVAEVAARGGRIILLASPGEEGTEVAEVVLAVPCLHDLVAPIVDVVPLQLLAYHVARNRGLDVDKPRNLAKTVTVE